MRARRERSAQRRPRGAAAIAESTEQALPESNVQRYTTCVDRVRVYRAVRRSYFGNACVHRSKRCRDHFLSRPDALRLIRIAGGLSTRKFCHMQAGPEGSNMSSVMTCTWRSCTQKAAPELRSANEVKSRLDRFHQTKAQPRGARAGDNVDGRDGHRDAKTNQVQTGGERGCRMRERKKASAPPFWVATTRNRNRADNRMRTEGRQEAHRKDGRWNSATGYTERAKEADRLEIRGEPRSAASEMSMSDALRGITSLTSLRR